MESLRAMRYTIVYGLYLLPLLALFVSSNLFFPYISGKNFAFRIIVLLLAGVWVLLMFKDPSVRPKKHSVTFVYLAFILIMTLSTVFGVAPHRSFWSNFERMDGLLHHLHLFMLYLISASVFTRVEWKRFFGVTIATSVAAMGFGLFQLASVFVITQGGDRLDSTFGNAIYFGGFLLFNLFLVGYWLHEREQLFVARSAIAGVALATLPTLQFAGWRLSSFFATLSQNGSLGRFMLVTFALIAIVAGGFALVRRAGNDRAAWSISLALIPTYLFFIYKSGSRGVLVGLVLGLGTVVVLAVLKSHGRIRRMATGSLVALLLTVSILIGVAQTSLGEQGGVLGRLEFSEIARTFETRTTLWSMGLEAAKERPILGWGPDTFIMVFNKYYDPALFDQEPWFDRSHNVFIDWLVHTGVLGFLAYVGIFVLAFYTLYRTTRFNAFQKAALAGILVAYVGQNVTVFDNVISSIFFYSLLAFIVSRDTGTDEQVLIDKPERQMPEGVFAAVGIFVALLTFSGVYGLHFRGVFAASGLLDGIRFGAIARQSEAQGAREAAINGLNEFNRVIGYKNMALAEGREQLVQYASKIIVLENITEEVRLRVLGGAAENIAAEVEREALNARAAYFHYALLRQVGQGELALIAINEAIERSPKRQLFLIEKAVLLANMGRFDEASVSAQEAQDVSEKRFNKIDGAIESLDTFISQQEG